MQNQARPTYRDILKFSVSIGGIFHTLCVPALADPNGEELILPKNSDNLTSDVLASGRLQLAIPTSDTAATVNQYETSTATASGISAPLSPQFSNNRETITAVDDTNTVDSAGHQDRAQDRAQTVDKQCNQQSELKELRIEETTGQEGVSVLSSDRIELAWTDKAFSTPQKEWLKGIVSSAECPALSTSQGPTASQSQAQLAELSRTALHRSDEPVLSASLLSDEQLEAESEGESVFTLDELIQIADSQLAPNAQEISTSEISTPEITVAMPEASGAEATTYASLKNDEAHQKEDAEADDEEGNEESTDESIDDDVVNIRPQSDEAADEWLQDLPDLVSEQQVVVEDGEKLDDELGALRLLQLRSRENEELGILRLLQTAEATPPPPKPPIAFLAGRLGYFSTDNAFRSEPRLDEEIYQSGLTFYVFPKLSDSTSLYGIAETNLARYENFESVNYNELEFQLGIRQRLARRTFAQIGWRNQRLYEPGYRERLFNVHYIDSLVSHRTVLNAKTWLDGFYQMRLGFADPDAASRLRQTFTLSLNYGATRDLRTSLIYQLDFDDYTQVSRFDTYQQVLGIISYNLTPESRITVFGGTRFGRSSIPQVNLNDTFYGAGLNVSVPLF